MALAALFFALMVACVKLAHAEMNTLEIIFWRGPTAVPLALIMAHRTGGLRVHNKKLLFTRSFLGFIAIYAFFTAASGLPLTTLALIGQLQPLCIAFLAPLFIGQAESVSPKLWGLLVIGFAGCGFIIGPGGGGTLAASMWALAAMLLSSGARLTLRVLGQTDTPQAIVFWFQTATLVFAGACLVATQGGPSLPDSGLLLPLIGVGVCATLGQLAMSEAFRIGRAARVSAASYTGPVFSVLLDIALFRLWPSGLALVGGVLVIGSGYALVADPESSK